MSSHIYEETGERPPMRQAWAGIVSTPAADFTDQIWVTIPDLDPNIRVGPCKWQARDQINLPSRGDSCLVIFDNDNAPWIPCWWPF